MTHVGALMMNPLRESKQFWLAFAFVVTAALILRLIHLTADPPHYFAGLGQALITDPYHITTYARNQALFGDWDPFDYDRWIAFRVSLVSGFSWLIFKFAGVSRATANLSSVLLNIFSIMLVAGALLAGDKEKVRARLAALLAAGFLGVSHLLIVYSRAPFLENGLLALASLVMFVTLRYGHKLVGAALAGALVPLCPFAGKLFGLAILVPAVVTLWLAPHERAKRLGAFVAGGVATTSLWVLFVLGDSAEAYFTYLQEQSLGLYGYPPGFTSVKLFISQAISFGGDSRIFEFQMFLPLALTIAILWFIYRRFHTGFRDLLRYGRENRALMFLALWAITVWLGLMPFQYRPVRYTLFAIYPGLALLGALLADAFTDGSRLRGRFGAYKNVILVGVGFLGSWYALTQGRTAWLGNELTRPMVEPIVWSSLFFAPLGVGLFWLGSRFLVTRGAPAVKRVLSGLIVFVIIGQGYWYVTMVRSATYDIQRFSRELGEVVDPSSVLTAPHAPNLALDTELKTVIYSFGLAYDDEDLFERFPITHLVADVGNIEHAEKKFPSTRGSLNIARTVFRDATVDVVRLRQAGTESMTDYERSLALAYAGQFDEAVFLAKKFSESHPNNAIALRNLVDLSLRAAEDSLGLAAARRLVNIDPRGSWSLAYVARVMFYLSERFGDRALTDEGEGYLKRAEKLNPPAAEFFVSYSRS